MLEVSEIPFPSLADEEILLRPWREADIVHQLAAFSDPVFLQHSDWAPTNRAEAQRQLLEQEQLRVQGGAINFAIVGVTDPGTMLGGISVNHIDQEQGRASLGYWLAPAVRGRGVASRAVRLVADWVFQTVRLARLEITCGPDNAGSQQVARRTGFTREGLLRSHMTLKGGRRDTVVFGLLPGELRL